MAIVANQGSGLQCGYYLEEIGNPLAAQLQDRLLAEYIEHGHQFERMADTADDPKLKKQFLQEARGEASRTAGLAYAASAGIKVSPASHPEHWRLAEGRSFFYGRVA